jgi:hypothetical protein
MLRRSLWCPPSARYVAPSPGCRVAAVLDAGRLRVVSTATGEVVAEHEVDAGAIAAAVSDDGAAAAIVRADRSVRVVAPAGRACTSRCGKRLGGIIQGGEPTESVSVGPHDLVFAPDGGALAVSGRELEEFEYYYGGGYVDSSAHTVVSTWPTGGETVVSLDSASDSLSYSASRPSKIADHAVAVAFSPCGRWCGVLLKGGRVRVFDRVAGSCSTLAPADVRAITFASGGRVVFVAGGAVTICELVDGGEFGSFAAPGEVVALAASDAGLACVDAGGGVAVLDWSGETRAIVAPDHASPAIAAAWSGEVLVLRHADGAVTTWS